jgi:hypothetical protein
MCRGEVSQQHHIMWVVVVILGVAVAASIIFGTPRSILPRRPSRLVHLVIVLRSLWMYS